MHVVIASVMGGLGDAAEFIMLSLFGLALLTMGGFLVFSWRRCSLIAARFAWVFVFAIGVLFVRPWFFLVPPSSGDPDEACFYLIGRLLCMTWASLIIATVACFARAKRHQQSKPDAQNAT